MSINMNDVRQKLQDRQYKLTSQRQLILQVFIDHQEKHLSAEDIYFLVRQQSPDIGLATVYRTLELLSDLEVLHKIDFGDGRSRYEINEKGTHHQHHHLICLSCNEVREFEDDLLDALEHAIAKKSNFTIINHQVKFYGYCQECQKNRGY